MLRHAFVAVFACVALAVTGCGDSTGSGGSNVAGTYTLRTVNGDTIPYTFRLENGVTTLTYTDGWITLKSDSTFEVALTYVISPAYQGIGKYTDDGDGIYTLKDGTIRLNRTDREINDYVGTLRRGTLTLIIEEGVFIFRR